MANDFRADDSRVAQLRRRQIAGLLLLVLLVLIVAAVQARHGDLFPQGWWRW